MHSFFKFIFGIKLHMFPTVPLSIIKEFFTVHTAMVYVIQVTVTACLQAVTVTCRVLFQN